MWRPNPATGAIACRPPPSTIRGRAALGPGGDIATRRVALGHHHWSGRRSERTEQHRGRRGAGRPRRRADRDQRHDPTCASSPGRGVRVEHADRDRTGRADHRDRVRWNLDPERTIVVPDPSGARSGRGRTGSPSRALDDRRCRRRDDRSTPATPRSPPATARAGHRDRASRHLDRHRTVARIPQRSLAAARRRRRASRPAGGPGRPSRPRRARSRRPPPTSSTDETATTCRSATVSVSPASTVRVTARTLARSPRLE